MPYIDQSDRIGLELLLMKVEPTTAGELNFCITVLIDQYLTEHFDYTSLNEAMGVLECVKQELYRRVAAPYEDAKRALNGEVWHSTVESRRAANLAKISRIKEQS
jgi:hypothetical protein